MSDHAIHITQESSNQKDEPLRGHPAVEVARRLIPGKKLLVACGALACAASNYIGYVALYS